MSTVPELQPDELDVLQAEEPDMVVTVPVAIASIAVPVRTQDLPRKGGATFNKTVGTVPVRLLMSDHRRAQARAVSVGQNMYVAFSNAMAQDFSRMALIPASTTFTMNHDGELWAASATGTTVVSIATELWAVGE